MPLSKQLLKSPWLRSVAIVVVILAITFTSIHLYGWVNRYAHRVVENRVAQIPVSITLANTPSWLHEAITNDILSEAVSLARRDDAMFARFQNPTDTAIFEEIRATYSTNLSLRSNAWVKKITRIQRVPVPQHNLQRIEIYAEYRQPVAWLRINDKFVLIDDEFVRLPGDYTDADRLATGGGASFLTITGLVENPPNSLPDPGRPFTAPELPAALQLANLLKSQNFARQIDCINLANYHSRLDLLASQIVLETIFRTPDNKPRLIYWGRPLGEERTWEIPSSAKLKALQQIQKIYQRIDANADFVDIRIDQVWIPKPATEAPLPTALAHARS